MRLNFNYLVLIISMISALSCNDDLSFNSSKSRNLIVLHAQAEVGKKIVLEVKQSELITEDTLNNPIDGVRAVLKVNGIDEDVTYSNSEGFASFSYIVTPRDTLAIELEKEGFDVVSAKTTTPENIGILQFDTTNKRLLDQGLRVSFYDRPNEKNYYQLVLIGERWTYQLDNITGERLDSVRSREFVEMKSINRIFFSDNNIVNNRQNFELLNDKIFNGKNFVLDVDVNRFALSEQIDKSAMKKLTVELKSISEAYYSFLTTLSLNRPIYGGPFSISSQVPSNVLGGYGIFATYSVDRAEIVLEQ